MTPKAKFYFQISTSSGVPIYRQVIDQVKTLIATGRMVSGSFLPSVRQVAEELEINPMTVSKAYSILEKEGVLEFSRGQGMTVLESVSPKKHLEKQENNFKFLLNEVVIRAHQLSLDQKKVIEMFASLWKEKGNE